MGAAGAALGSRARLVMGDGSCEGPAIPKGVSHPQVREEGWLSAVNGHGTQRQ